MTLGGLRTSGIGAMTKGRPTRRFGSDHDPDEPVGNPGETGMRNAALEALFPAGWILRGPVTGSTRRAL